MPIQCSNQSESASRFDKARFLDAQVCRIGPDARCGVFLALFAALAIVLPVSGAQAAAVATGIPAAALVEQPLTVSTALERGFNLVGNSLSTPIDVVAAFGNAGSNVAGVTSNIISIWKWDAANGRWQFHSPQLTNADNAALATANGYAVLSAIEPGAGYWINASVALTLPAQMGMPAAFGAVDYAALAPGFNLLAIADSVSPADFNLRVNSADAGPTTLLPNVTSLWVWDAVRLKWYFYSANLELAGGQAGISSFVQQSGYLHFEDAPAKRLGPGIGFWVNRPRPQTPTISISDNVALDIAKDPVSFTFDFSEDIGSSFSSTDVVVTGGTASAFSRASGRRAVLVVTPSANARGRLGVSVAAGAVTSLAGAASTVAVSATQDYDTTAGASAETGTCSASGGCVGFDTPNLHFVEFEGLGNTAPVNDPLDRGNRVLSTTKFPPPGQFFAGVTIGTDGGGARTVPPISFGDNKLMTLRVLAPAAGDRIMLKLENSADGQNTFVTAEAVTRTANSWETLTFDFNQPTAGNYDPTRRYDVISIFPYFGSVVAENRAYYFDELKMIVPGIPTGTGSCGLAPNSPACPDSTPPAVAFSDDITSGVVTAPFTVALKFSEDVGNSLTVDDVVVSGGTVTGFNRISNSEATLVVTPAANTSGTLSVSVAAGGVSDQANNTNIAAPAYVRAVNTRGLPASDEWVMNWSDEFNGSTLDPNVWNYDLGDSGWGNNELEYYQPSNARVQDGFLTITAKRGTSGAAAYTSARLQTSRKKNFTYGRFEIRARLPGTQGIWPAFWLLGNTCNSFGLYGGNIPWPNCGEIDIMEMIGGLADGSGDYTTHGTLHYLNAQGFNPMPSFRFRNPDKLSADFHTYTLDWTPQSFTWYFDGVAFGSKAVTTDMATFNKPFFLLLNLAVGGNWPGLPDATTILPQRLEIDYVRHYTRSSLGVAGQ